MENFFKKFLDAELTDIDIHKWILSEAAGHDLKEKAVEDWVMKRAKPFRREYIDKLLKSSIEDISVSQRTMIHNVEDAKAILDIVKDKIDTVNKLMEIVDLEKQLLNILRGIPNGKNNIGEHRD
jgi:hypothetical protein